MRVEMTVGLSVNDQAMYAQYRAEMRPILESAGGSFRYDFDVSLVRQSETGKDINRVFVLCFPSTAAKEQFFANPTYLEIRARLFEKSVTQTIVIAEYER